LIAGPGGVFICNECVDLCNEIIAEESRPPAQESRQQRPTRQSPPSPVSEEEKLRSKAATSGHEIAAMVGARQYTAAVAEAEGLLSCVRRLRDLESSDPGGSDSEHE
jgi:hypothetical protein